MTADGLCKVEQSKVYSELKVRSEKQESFAIIDSIRSYYAKSSTLVTVFRRNICISGSNF